MPRIILSLAEWHNIARELAATHTSTAPPGLLERVQTLLTQTYDGWTDQPLALELDESCAEAVQTVHRTLTGDDPDAGQRSASLAEADTIIRDHQNRL